VTFRGPLLFALAVVAAGCGSSASTSTTITSPTSTRCEANVSSSATSFGPSGGNGTINVTVARECAWQATSAASWVTFTGATDGQGDGTVGFRVGQNADPVARQAAVSIAGRSVSLSQQGPPCVYTLGSVPASISEQGGQSQIDLQTHAACSWTARSESAWASITPTSGSGSAQLRITVAANSGSDRPVVFTIATHQVTTTQRGAPAPAPAPPPTPTPTPPPPSPTPTPTPPPPSAPVPVLSVTLTGDVASLTGSCPNWTFSLGIESVFTTNSTNYERGPCTRMKNGERITVNGWLMSDATVRADQIRFVE
jgi:hypothetical protein